MPDGEKIKEVEENEYQYLSILEYNKIKETKKRENFWREYLRGKELITKSRLNGRNKIMAINTWAVSLTRYGASIVKWTQSELDEIDNRLGKTWQRIRNYSIEVISTGCIYQG